MATSFASSILVVDAAAPRQDLVAAFNALHTGADAAGVAATVAWMEAALAEYGLRWRIHECLRISRYGVWLGVADAARGAGPADERVFLAGDAAHSHSPHGGQGANAGLQDGWNLGWKLALACRRDAAATRGLLASYGAERAPVWRGVVRMADALKRLSAEPHPRSALDALARAAWRLLPYAAQRTLLLERFAHKAFVYAQPLGCEDSRADASTLAGLMRSLDAGGAHSALRPPRARVPPARRPPGDTAGSANGSHACALHAAGGACAGPDRLDVPDHGRGHAAGARVWRAGTRNEAARRRERACACDSFAGAHAYARCAARPLAPPAPSAGQRQASRRARAMPTLRRCRRRTRRSASAGAGERTQRRSAKK